MDLNEFAEEIGSSGPVTIAGLATRGGPVDDVRTVMAPVGIEWVQPDEMTICCGAGTPLDEIDAVLSVHGQSVAIPPFGTIGGALAVGRSGLRRLGYGPVRDTLLQTHYVNAEGQVVKAGGPTVKNVSGFDLCRLLVGSHGTLGFLGDVILRTRPRARHEQWFVSTDDPESIVAQLYRPISVLWDGTSTWVLLEGNRHDVETQAGQARLRRSDPPDELPTGGRWSVAPSELPALVGTGKSLPSSGSGSFTTSIRKPPREIPDAIAELHRRVKHEFDPEGRLNPGVDVLSLV